MARTNDVRTLLAVAPLGYRLVTATMQRTLTRLANRVG